MILSTFRFKQIELSLSLKHYIYIKFRVGKINVFAAYCCSTDSKISTTYQHVLCHCFADIKAGVLGFCAGDVIAFRANEDVWLALVQINKQNIQVKWFESDDEDQYLFSLDERSQDRIKKKEVLAKLKGCR